MIDSSAGTDRGEKTGKKGMKNDKMIMLIIRQVRFFIHSKDIVS